MTSEPEIGRLIQKALELDRAGRLSEAEAAYQAVLAMRRNLANCWYNLGVVQRRLGRFESALKSYEEALAHGVPQPEAVHVNRGVIFSDVLRQPVAAERELRSALRLNPSFVPALLNLANLHEDRGERAPAQDLYEKVLAIEPRTSEALARLANVSRIKGPHDPIIARVRAALAIPGLSPAELASLGFALGRALDAAGAYDEAFQAYREANRQAGLSAPSAPPYDRGRHEALISDILAAFPAPTPGPRVTGGRRAPPIFICGMFRSGSTLVEQVLAAHRKVTAGGELEILPVLVRNALAPFPASIASLSPERASALAAGYLDEIARRFPSAGALTDKRPDNYLYIGVIKRLFPDAKIVHTVRAPLDNCLSIYFLHVDPAFAYARDLKDIAHNYRHYRRLIAHFTALYPDDIFDFDYDAFVKEPRPVLERLLAFLGLDWDESCLAFERSPAVVRTASVWQVREPLYARSSGRWRHYAKALDDVRMELGDLAMEAADSRA